MLIHENKIDKIIKESIRKYLNESKINFSKMIFVAFGSNKFDLDKVTPVDFANHHSKIINKVMGGGEYGHLPFIANTDGLNGAMQRILDCAHYHSIFYLRLNVMLKSMLLIPLMT